MELADFDNVAIRFMLFWAFGGDDPTTVNMFIYETANSSGTLLPPNDFSKINPNNEMFIAIHGFNSVYQDFNGICELQKLKYPDRTVINVDWGQMAAGFNYFKAAKNVETVGRHLGQWLVNSSVDLSKVYVMGMSMGAHVAGYLGKEVIDKTGNKIKQITGVEPGGLCFSLWSLLPAYVRLDAGDADSVLCYHTNRGFMGSKFNLGTIDVYVNNGWMQPGCEKKLQDLVCSHYLAVALFAGTIFDMNLKAYRMDSFSDQNRPVGLNKNDSIILGQPMRKGNVGLYYMETHGSSPFYKDF